MGVPALGPGVYQLTNGLMTVRDLVFKADSTFPEAFLSKATLIRILPNEKKEIITFDLSKAIAGDPYNNLVLQNRDEVTVYTEETFHPTKNVEIAGAVRNPGSFTRYQNMTLSELIILAGGLTDAATTKEIEITRLDTLSTEIYAQKFSVNLPKEYWIKNKHDDFFLQDFDRVLVKNDPAKTYENNISIQGEVQFPGSYTILYEGEKITDFLSRAGGFKNAAYKEGIYVKRETRILNRIESVEFSDSLRKNYFDKPIYDRENFTKEFSNRIPIRWDEIEEDHSSEYNLQLQPGDVVVVPKNPDVVYVAGEVGIPSSVPYKKGASLSYYIKQAGGYLKNSAEGEEIVVQPNGKKWETSGWFFISNDEIESGATILVPSMIESNSDSWPVIRDIVTVVSSAAVLVLTVTNLTK
jgi:protein involved in polysaccharide export with SLBB domain